MGNDGAKEWLAVVDDDIRQVVNNLHGPMPSVTGAAYHCQRAAEKLVKACLVAVDIDFPRTHDIAALVGLLPQAHPLRDRLTRMGELTPFATAYRYPAEDEWTPPTREEIARWQREIEDVLAILRGIMPPVAEG